MPAHPLWRPFEQVSDEEIRAARVPDRPRAPTTIEVVAYDEAWPAAYERLAGAVRDALGHGVLGLEHVGSTAVPGLAAKALIDVDLVVADPTDEAAYVPALEAAGFVLRLRERPEERAPYEAAKREAAAQGFSEGMHYNNHKGGVVYDIYERIFAADPAHSHDPHPR